MPPMSSCPSAPMFQKRMRKAMEMAMPQKISGSAILTVSVSTVREPRLPLSISIYTASG